MENIEVLIIGCGIAGATAALRLARNPERQITIITRAREIQESNTRYAQGGIIGRGPDDSSDLLFEDIVAAGAGVTSPSAARILAEEGPPTAERSARTKRPALFSIIPRRCAVLGSGGRTLATQNPSCR